MEGIKLGLIITRALQLLFALIILGISANLTHLWNEEKDYCEDYTVYYDCNFDGVVPAVDYSLFVGVFGFVVAAICFAATFSATGIIRLSNLVFDGLAAIFYFASGINLAVKISDVIEYIGGNTYHQTEAAAAFQFLAFASCLASIALVVVARHRDTSKYPSPQTG